MYFQVWGKILCGDGSVSKQGQRVVGEQAPLRNGQRPDPALLPACGPALIQNLDTGNSGWDKHGPEGRNMDT